MASMSLWTELRHFARAHRKRWLLPLLALLSLIAPFVRADDDAEPAPFIYTFY